MLDTIVHTSQIFGAESSGGGIAALGVDAKALLLQIATFLIVFFLLKKFALTKIVDVLEERHNTINKGVLLGQKMIEEKDRLDKEVEKVLHKARIEADKIIAAGHHEAGELLKEAEASAARKADALISDAHARIEDDITQAKKGLEKEMLKLLSEATEAVIDEKLDVNKDKSFIEKMLAGAKN